MIDEKMAKMGEEFLLKLLQTMEDSVIGGGKISLVLVNHLINKYKDNMDDKVFIKLEKGDFKEYSAAFDEVNLEHQVEQVKGEDNVVIVFEAKDKQKYEEALTLIEKARRKVNEVKLSDFMKNNSNEDLSKKYPLDITEVSRLRDYLNMGDLEYSIYNIGRDYGVVFKTKNEEEVSKLIERVQADFAGKEGRLEKTKVLMQIASMRAAELELNKPNTSFIIVDSMFPDSHIEVEENSWRVYQDNVLVKESTKGISTHQHRVEVLDHLWSIKEPLIMSREEYLDVEKRKELIQRAYLKIEEFENSKEITAEIKKEKEEFISPSGVLISFNKEWGGHKFTPEELLKLKRGEEITITDLVNKKGEYYSAIGTLREQENNNGSKYYGFKMEKYIPQEKRLKELIEEKTSEKVILKPEQTQSKIKTEKITIEEKKDYHKLFTVDRKTKTTEITKTTKTTEITR